MLRDCLALVEEMDELPGMIRAHSRRYAEELALQFMEMAKLKGHSVEADSRGGKVRVVVDGRAKFDFVSYSRSEYFRARLFREIYTDHAVWVHCEDPDYD
jgi:hypothetical protein